MAATRRVLVWGVGSAVGRQCALAAADSDAELVVVDDDLGTAVSVAAACGAGHGALAADPLDENQVAAVGAEVEARWPGLDTLVDCSAAMELWAREEDSAARMTAVLAGNVTAPWLHVGALAAALGRGHAPAVVLLGSIDGSRANPGVTAYSAAKAGTASLARSLAATLGPLGIRVNCVAASDVFQTRTADGPPRRPTGDAAEAAALTPLGALPTAEQVAAAVVFLASPAAGGISGATLPVDGGRTAVTPGTWRHPGTD